MKYVMLVFLFVILTVSFVALDIFYIIGKLYIQEFGEANLLPLFKGTSRLLALHVSIYSLVVLILSIFISHKFAGPLFRLEKVAEAIADGDLTARANLRKGDELFETADTMNVMIEKLRQKLLKQKHLSDRICKKLTELSRDLRSGKMTSREASSEIDNVQIEASHIASDFKLE